MTGIERMEREEAVRNDLARRMRLKNLLNGIPILIEEAKQLQEELYPTRIQSLKKLSRDISAVTQMVMEVTAEFQRMKN